MVYRDDIYEKIVKNSFEPLVAMGQYFLCDISKINRIIDATDIQANDTVAEIGAGIGSVARNIPPVRRLSLVELDERLAEILRNEFSNREDTAVHCEDAIGWVESNNFDVLFSNLPSCLTKDVLNQLVDKTFRIAVVSINQSNVLDEWRSVFNIDEIEKNSGDDFYPPQQFTSNGRTNHATHAMIRIERCEPMTHKILTDTLKFSNRMCIT